MSPLFARPNEIKGLSPLCQQLLDEDLQLFHDDYQQHYLEGESKSSTIGEPYLLYNPDSTQSILLIHGLMAAPEEVREWAEDLFAKGFTVYAPRMAGHGTSAVDLSQRTMAEWIESVNRGHEILKACSEQVSIAGFSTGGAVALYQVMTKPGEFESLISVSAPLKFKKFSAHFARPVNHWNRALRLLNAVTPLNTKRFGKEFATNHADNPHINYLRCPVSSIVEIQQLMKCVQKNISTITTPALIIHGTGDPKVDVKSGRALFKLLPEGNKHYKEIDFHLHGIIRGDIAQRVFREVGLFLGLPKTA